MLRHIATGVVMSALSFFNLCAMAPGLLLKKEIPTLFELSKQTIIDQEPHIFFEQQLPVYSIGQEQEYEWLRDAALRNMFRNFGLDSDPQRMRDLVAEKPERLYRQKIIKGAPLGEVMGGQNSAIQLPIDLIDPGFQMTEDHRYFIKQLRAQGFRFNSAAGRKLVFRAAANKNIDFMYYALQHKFDVCAYQQDVETSLAYMALKDYSYDILLPFLTVQPGQQFCTEFLPVIKLLIKAGAKVRKFHIDQADQVGNKKLKNLLAHYFNPDSNVSDIGLSMLLKNEKSDQQLTFNNNTVVFNRAVLKYLEESQVKQHKKLGKKKQ